MNLPTPEELKQFRIKKGISQTELAKLSEVSQSQIARMENGSVNPRIGTVRKIIFVLEQITDSPEGEI